MIPKGLKERFLKYKKPVIILISIILLLTIGLIFTIIFMPDSAGKFYLICVEGIFIFVFSHGIYFLLSETVARKINPNDYRFHLSKEEYDKFLKASKEMDKFAK